MENYKCVEREHSDMSLDSDDVQCEVVERVWDEVTDDSDISTTVVTAVARARGVDPTDLPPLYEHIDPEALDALVTHDVSRARQANLEITFAFAEYGVTVRSDGEVVVSGPPTPV